jgi:hypothetical protein
VREPIDPANNRVFGRFNDGAGVARGSTSVAVTTAPWPPTDSRNYQRFVSIKLR